MKDLFKTTPWKLVIVYRNEFGETSVGFWSGAGDCRGKDFRVHKADEFIPERPSETCYEILSAVCSELTGAIGDWIYPKDIIDVVSYNS